MQFYHGKAGKACETAKSMESLMQLNSDPVEGRSKLPKILLNGNNICMASAP
jgi:hypothetical protein